MLQGTVARNGSMSLLFICDPGSELRFGWRAKRKTKIIVGMGINKK